MPRAALAGTVTVPASAARSRYGRNVARVRNLLPYSLLVDTPYSSTETREAGSSVVGDASACAVALE